MGLLIARRRHGRLITAPTIPFGIHCSLNAIGGQSMSVFILACYPQGEHRNIIGLLLAVGERVDFVVDDVYEFI